MQEPGANASEIYSVLRHVRPGDDFVPNFEMFAKSDVNGKDQNPIYEFLKGRCPSVRAEFQASYKLYYEPYHQDDIRWGDTKWKTALKTELFQVEFWKVPGEPPGPASASLWRITWSFSACKYPPWSISFFSKKAFNPISFLGPRYWRSFGPVWTGPCILNPHPLKIQVLKEASSHLPHDLSGLKLSCSEGDGSTNVLTLVHSSLCVAMLLEEGAQ